MQSDETGKSFKADNPFLKKTKSDLENTLWLNFINECANLY